MKRAIWIFLVVGAFACTESDNNPLGKRLEGKWVDEVTKTDTLEFIVLEDRSTLMSLRRGREVINGYDLPKIGSGLYTYELSGEEISLYYTLSSSSRSTDYFFKQKGSKLEIGRFFESDNEELILTFRKLD